MSRWIWVLLVFLVFLRYFSTRPSYQDGSHVRISGRVTSEPIRYANSQRVSFAGLRFNLELYPEITYGDEIVVEGRVEDGKLKEPKLVSLREPNNVFFSLRKKLVDFYSKSLPYPHGALVSGIVLGSKANLGEGFWRDLRETGVAHVVVASGTNVTMVAAFLVNLLVIFFPRRRAVPLAIAGIWGYSFLSGFDAPIVRSSIMGTLAYGAQGMGRVSRAWRLLILSALLMLLAKPDWITDLGFILSFVATASLLLFESKINRLIHFVPSIFREGLSTSLAAQIGVAPIILITFGQFNVLSPIINALVLWTIPLVMVVGALGGIVGLIIPFLGQIMMYLVYPFTTWFIWVVQSF